MGKSLLAIALAGSRLILFDNREINSPVGGAALDAAITAQTISGRILGLTRFETDVPFNAVVVCTGNNISLQADASDRVVIARLESTVEKPAERDDWRIPGLLEFVRKRRGPLASAALTILKSFHCAGRPAPDPRPKLLGGFESWNDLIRYAVIWTVGFDPCATRGAAKSVDTTAVALPALVAGWADLCQACGAEALSTTQALKTLAESPGAHTDLHTLLSESTRDGRLPSPQHLGNTLGRVRGRVVAGKALDRTEIHGVNQWFVRTLPLQ